jgi:hypothetical protein
MARFLKMRAGPCWGFALAVGKAVQYLYTPPKKLGFHFTSASKIAYKAFYLLVVRV